MRTLQVPLDRFRRRRGHEDGFDEQRLHLPQPGLGRGVQPAEVSDPMPARRRHMAQIPPQELVRRERALKILNERLRKLVAYGLATRADHSAVSLHVEYTLTPTGVIEQLHALQAEHAVVREKISGKI